MDERAASPNESSSKSCELCPKAKLLDGSSLQIVTYGFLAPPIVLVTLVTNFFVCLVLIQKKMRNQTSVILVALAISDSLTGLFPLPFFLYFYTAGHYVHHLPFVPYEICSTYVAFKELLPTMSHTCSIWLTVTLALQRYLCVCRPTGTNVLEIGKTVRIIVFVFVSSVAAHLCRFAEYTYLPVPYGPAAGPAVNSTAPPDGGRMACYRVPWLFYGRYKNLYFYAYYLLLRAVFIHILPCILLVVVNAILIRKMRMARERRIKLFKNQKRHKKSNCDGHASTLMLVIVVCCFLLVELPLAVLFILLIISSFFKIEVLPPLVQVQASIILNAFIMFSYPINFFIYSIMSKSFRQSFVDLFRSSSGGGGGNSGSRRPDKSRERNGRNQAAPTAERPQFLPLKPRTVADADRSVAGEPYVIKEI